tara:strand:+ start:415 stop:624 length:210 start_codon:yes stop_codon:yes gene_type:complete
VSAGDGAESFTLRRIESTASDMFAENSVKETKTLGVVGHVHIRKSKTNSQTVKLLEENLEQAMPGHHTV